MKKRLLFISALIFFFPCILAHSDDERIQVTYSIDWRNAYFSISAQAEIPDNQRNRPAARHQSLRRIENQMPQFLAEGIIQIPLDSEHIIQDDAVKQQLIIQNIDSIFENRDEDYSRLSPDRQYAMLTCHFPLHSLISKQFQQATTARPIPRVLGWAPQAEYSGVIIYMAHTPFHNTQSESYSFKGTLFPAIRNTQGRIVFDHSMVEPEIIRSIGMNMYESECNQSVAQRVGSVPLRITGYASYGNRPSDIILSPADMHFLLANASTREALRQGKLAIILPAQNIIQQY